MITETMVATQALLGFEKYLPARLRRSETPCEPEPWRRRTFDVRPIDADDRIEFPDLCHFGRDMRQSCEICE